MIAGAFRFIVVYRDASERNHGEWLSVGGSRDLDRARVGYLVCLAYPERDVLMLDTSTGLAIARRLGRVTARQVAA